MSDDGVVVDAVTAHGARMDDHGVEPRDSVQERVVDVMSNGVSPSHRHCGVDEDFHLRVETMTDPT
jgi:hypothetical protein